MESTEGGCVDGFISSYASYGKWIFSTQWIMIVFYRQQ